MFGSKIPFSQRRHDLLDYFAIRFVFGESPPDRPTMIQVGPSGGPAAGWVPMASVLEWDTRLMARPTPRAGRPALVIYREETCLLDALAGLVRKPDWSGWV